METRNHTHEHVRRCCILNNEKIDREIFRKKNLEKQNLVKRSEKTE